MFSGLNVKSWKKLFPTQIIGEYKTGVSVCETQY